MLKIFLLDEVMSYHDITSRLMASLLVDLDRLLFSKVGPGAKRFENHCLKGVAGGWVCLICIFQMKILHDNAAECFLHFLLQQGSPVSDTL